MFRRRLVLVAGVAAIIPLVWSQRGSNPPALPPIAASRQVAEDPGARQRWEEQRLVDPATGELPRDIRRLEQIHAKRLPVRAVSKRQVEDWQWRGPTNVGGRTRALAVDISDPTNQTLLAGGASGGMWRTVDGGESWTLTTGSSQLQNITAVAQDTRPGRTQTWYYGTGEYRGGSGGASGAQHLGDGVFRSDDGGVTWTQLPATASNSPASQQNFDLVWEIVTDPTNLEEDEVYAATFGGIYRSVDGGGNWTYVLGSIGMRSRFTDVAIASNGVLWASLSSDGQIKGIWRSEDGILWEKNEPDGFQASHRVVFAIAPSDPSTVYSIFANYNVLGNNQMFRYDETTSQWTPLDDILFDLPNPVDQEPWAYQTYLSYCQTLTVHPQDPETVFLGGVNLYRHRSGFRGSAGTELIGGHLYPDFHADQQVLVFPPGSTRVAFAGNDGGVYRTDDILAAVVEWTPLNNGYNTSQFYTVALDEHTPGSPILVGGLQDNGSYWTGSGTSTTDWIHTLGGDGSFCAIGNTSGPVDTYYLSAQVGQVFRVRLGDNGDLVNWTQVDPVDAGFYLFINPFILDPLDPNVMYVTTAQGVWRNVDLDSIPDYQESPTDVGWEHFTTEPDLQNLSAIALSRAPGRTLYYATSEGAIFKVADAPNQVAGVTPTNISDGQGLPVAYVSSLAVNPQDDAHVLVGYSNYGVVSIYETTDAGATWTAVEGNLAGDNGPSVRSLAIAPSAFGSIFYAGTSTGLYSTLTLNGNATVWARESNDLIGANVVDMVTTRVSDGTVAVATHGRGVYTQQLATGPTAVPDLSQTQLKQNVPNPFNPRTTISYTVSEPGHAELAVYDTRGRLVRTLVDGPHEAGPHTSTWAGQDEEGRAVASGVYYYRLVTTRSVETREMTLIR